ncbi:ubiquinol oxidase subunit II [Camelimonas abortus]|uniref:Ubiquinol oxidase polypeptide II n=1 Tax=Camelimonas abortus TaxID=1017184 RepID=A0ABV7LEL7_9HYPH
MKIFRTALMVPVIALLGGCNFVVLHPAGFVAEQQRDVLLISTALMLLVIAPVMALTAYFAWRYRASNAKAAYDPDWDHSTALELVIWSAPLLIIICLGAVTWMGTHLLDPYRRLDRVSRDAPVPADVKPLEVQVAALDWKWLFIYPEQGIAVVNEMAAPVNRPVHFRITASAVMNSFYVPALAGQIYAMPAMQSQLHAVINRPGEYAGFSANYSGAGFSQMRFRFLGLDDAGFAQWVQQAKEAGGVLDRAAYLELEQPSVNAPVRRFGAVEPNLFDLIRNLCVEPGRMCRSEMMAVDAAGGLGPEGLRALVRPARTGLARLRRPGAFVASICTPEQALAMASAAPAVDPGRSWTPAAGLGLPRPGSVARQPAGAAAAPPLAGPQSLRPERS